MLKYIIHNRFHTTHLERRELSAEHLERTWRRDINLGPHLSLKKEHRRRGDFEVRD